MGDLPRFDSELGVGLVLLGTRFQPGDDLPYSIVNDGDLSIMTGLAYALDLHEDARWHPLALGLNFRAVGFGVTRDQPRDLMAKVPADARPGAYRLRKSIGLGTPPHSELEHLPSAARRLPMELAAEFKVVEQKAA